MGKKIILISMIFHGCMNISADTVATFPDLLRVGQPLVSKNYLYLKDGVTIYIHSLSDFKLIKKFGKEGEGPEEFKRAIYWWGVRGDSLVVQSMGRLTYFTLDGRYLKEVKVKALSVFWIPLGKRLVGMRNFLENSLFFYRFRLFDQKQNQLKILVNYPNHYQRNKSVNPVLDDRWPLFDTHDNKIFIENQDKNGIIEVFDYNGAKLFSIGSDLESIKVTPQDEARYIHYYSTTPGFKRYYEEHKKYYHFPAFFPKIRWFCLADKKVYVVTHQKIGSNNQINFYIYGMSGKRLEIRTAPLFLSNDITFFPFTIKQDQLYQMVEDSDTEIWELHVSPLKKSG